MRILFYRYNSICEPDVMMGFEELGYEVDTIELEIEKKTVSPHEMMDAVVKELDKKSYDAVFSINYYPLLSKIAGIYHIRYISWTVDSPVMELWSETLAGEWNRTFIFDRNEYEIFKDTNPGKIFHMPLATNVNRNEQLFESLKGEENFKEDISFVGSLYSEKNPIMGMDNINTSYVGGYLKGACELQSRIYGGFLLDAILNDDIINEVKANLKNYYTPPETFLVDDRYTLSSFYLAPWATTIERERIAELLYKNFSFGLYTRSDLSHLSVKGKGSVKTLTEMPQVFRNSTINLNVTHKGIKTGIPLRIFDIMGARGFVLSNYQIELFDLFVPGEDFDFFTSDEELVEKTSYYLKHKDMAKEIAENAFEKVKENHSYPIRLSEMMKLAFSV